jgi:hypothetical protein
MILNIRHFELLARKGIIGIIIKKKMCDLNYNKEEREAKILTEG